VLFYPQDPAHAVYLVEEGLIRLFLLGRKDEEATLALLGPGGLLGEAAFFGGTYGAYAEPLVYTEGVSFSGRELALLMNKSPEVARLFLELGLERLKEAERRLAEQRLLPVFARLARLLLRHFPDGEVPLSHQDLAALVGATRETVTKLLGEWALKGILELGYRKVQVVDKEALARMLEEV
jgi:CRP-like cAMP-binding protein